MSRFFDRAKSLRRKAPLVYQFARDFFSPVALWWYLRALIRFRLMGGNKGEATIYVVLEKAVPDRSLYLLLRFLTAGGQKVGVLTAFSLLHHGRFDLYARMIYTLEDVIFWARAPRETTDKILLFDRDVPRYTARRWAKEICLDYDISASRGSQRGHWYVMPYTMHPLSYASGQDESLCRFRVTSPSMRLFFAGNMDARTYVNPRNHDLFSRFGILSRPSVIKAIAHGLGDDVLFVTDGDQMERLLRADDARTCVLVDRATYAIRQDDWLAVLSRGDFFLCPPGVVQPLCHNAIEAMAVGTIPLVNYPEWFTPPLEDMKTCVVFTDEEELIQRAKYILALDRVQIEQMKRQIIDYYEDHLSPRSFLRKINDLSHQRETLFLHTERDTYVRWVRQDSVLLGRAGDAPST